MMAFDEILTDVFIYLIIAGIVGGGTLCMALYRCVHKQGKRGLRQSKAILLMAKSIDGFTKKNHPGDESDLYEKSEIALTDEKGEL